MQLVGYFYEVFFVGYLYDIYGYDVPFYCAGGAMLLSGCFSMALRKLSSWERNRHGSTFNSDVSSDDDMKKDPYIKPQELVGMWAAVLLL